MASCFAAVRLGAHHWRPSSFVVAGDQFADRARTPRSLVIRRGPGYDGQFVYRLALEPLSRRATERGITLDNPPYRQQRILLPVLAWMGSLGGRPELVAWALIALNLLAIGALGWMGGAIAKARGRPGIVGAALGLVPATATALARDTNEAVALALVVGGILLWRRRRRWPAALAWTLAALARETTLLIPGGVILTGLWLVGRGSGGERRRRLRDYLPALTPFAVWAAWQVVLHSWWGRYPVRAGGSNVGLPFAGVSRIIDDNLRYHLHSHRLVLFEVGVVLAIAAATGWLLPRSRALVSERMAWVLSMVLVLCLTGLVWVEGDASFRALAETMGVGVVILLGVKARLADAALLAGSGLWVLVALLHLRAA
jgi:hypothetical protein